MTPPVPVQPRDLGIGQLFERVRDAVIVADAATGTIVLWNPAAEALFGYTAAEVVGRSVELLVPEHLRDRHRAGLARYRQTGHGRLVDSQEPFELPALRRTMEEVRIELTLSSIAPVAAAATIAEEDEPAARGQYVLAIMRDVTERKRAEAALRERAVRLRGLHEAALAIAAPVAAEPRGVVGLLARIVTGAVTATGGLAGKLVVAEDPLWEDLVAGTVAPAGHVTVRHTGQVAREALRPNDDVRHALTTGQPVFVADVSQPSSFGPFPLAIQRGVASFAVVPLQAAGRALGALVVDFARPGELAEEDRETLTLFAAHASAALERVRLAHLEQQHAREQAARAAAEDAQRRLALLAEASHAVAEASLDLQAILQVIAQRSAEVIGDRCVVRLLSEDGQWLNLAAVFHPNPEALAFLKALYAAPHRVAEGVSGRVAQAGEPVLAPVVSAAEARAVTKPEYWPYLERFGVHSFMVVPLRVQGRILGTLSMSRDTPGRPYTPEDLRLLEDLADRAALAIEHARLYHEAQAAIRLRDTFLAVAAHELKTPMTSLRGVVQLLLRRLNAAGAVEAHRLRQALQTVDQQTAKLARLVSRLFDVTNVEAGRLPLEQEVVDLVPLVAGVAATAQAMTSEHRIAIRGLPSVRTLVDPLRVEQVIFNLLDNAIKYSPDGGAIEIEIEAAPAVGDARPEQRLVQVAVRDHGLGIPAERRAHIFERFYQAHENHHRSGMGLGLYVSRQIARGHGGDLTVEFPSDGGTRFILVLPLYDPAPRRDPKEVTG